MRDAQHSTFPAVALVVSLLAILVTGCAVGPDYHQPDVTALAHDEWKAAQQAPARFDLSRQPASSWWRQFDDAVLSGLITRLFASNRVLAGARERIVEVSARYGVVEADNRLQLAAALGYTRAETGDDAASLQGLPPGQTLDIFSSGVTAGWELDVWGKTGRLLEAAEEDIKAEYADYHSMMVSLAAELTLAYIDVRTLEARIEKLHENISLQQKSLELAKLRHAAGNGTALAVVRGERLVQTTTARIPELERRYGKVKNRINVLLGKTMHDDSLEPGPMPAVPDVIGIGVPADLVTRRPDIRKAFNRYHAALARIGAVEAQRYPTLSLSGTLSLSSDSLGGMLDTDALIYTLGPGLQFPLVTGGRIQSGVEVQKSRTEQARIGLEQVILGALAEVEDGVAGIVRAKEQVAKLEEAEQLAQKSVKLSDELYRAGLSDVFQVLDNQQTLVGIQDSLLLARQQQLAEIVYLYRALGGGWEESIATAGREPAGIRQSGKAEENGGQL